MGYCYQWYPYSSLTVRYTDRTRQSQKFAHQKAAFNSSNPIPLTRLADREANINIDGRVNDLAWSGLPIYNELRVLRPDTLKSAPYRTDVRFFSGSTRSETAISVWFLDMAYVNCVNATTSLAI